ncbi:hypothetical protein O988_06277 [Pseudogymnoascus sp. VKM F-3808]|nr:hypothetical protein O988_06277 [Pseudogymnoascus sp. VKM F-3808]
MSRKLDTPASPCTRNVHIYDNHGHVLGGLYQNGSVNNLTLYDMCTVFIITPEPFTLFRLNEDESTGPGVFRTRVTAFPTSYIVLSSDGKPIPIQISDEYARRRIITKDNTSSKLTTTQKCFRNRVRSRDGQCVMTGIPTLQIEDFTLFNSTHIFPYAREQAWVDQGLARCVTDTSSPQDQGATKIHSVQNGLLLSLNARTLFETYVITVDINDGYKIICLTQDALGVDGRTLDLNCRDPENPDRVPDELLQWHYQQAVLAKIKGEGQKTWELQLTDWGDSIGEIREEPDAAERMEVELFTRLGPGEIDYSSAPELRPP